MKPPVPFNTVRLAFFAAFTSTALIGMLLSQAEINAVTGTSAAKKVEVQLGKILKRSYTFKEADNKNQEYALYLSSTYDKSKPAPLIVLLHGLGSNPKQVMRYEGITKEAEKRGYIVVAPYGYNKGGWYGSRGQGNNLGFKLPPKASQRLDVPDNLGELSEKDVLNVLEIALANFNIDRKRIYLMGHSMGGGGTFYLGMKYKEKWAALAPLSPAIYSNPNKLAEIPEMPIIVVQGEKDRLVPTRNVRRWVAKMKELKMPHQYIEIKGGNHATSITKNPKMIGQVFDFLDKHRRK